MKASRAIWILGFCAAIGAAGVIDAQRQALQYPQTKKGDVVDDYHGTKVPDPYQWMEDLDSKDVAAWVAAQNEITNRYLANLPARGYFKERISVLWDYPKTTIPAIEAGTLFYRQNSGLQKQAPIFMRASLDAKPQLLIDPNTLWPDGATSLSTFAASPDARYLAYTTAEGGADWQTVHVKDLTSGKDLADAVQWMRFSGLSWTKDAKGFFYSRYPEPPKGKVLQAALSGQALYYHRVGTAQSEDRLIYERKDLPTWFVFGGVTEDGRYVLISLAEGSSNNNRLYMIDLGDPKQPNVTAPVKPVIETDGAEFSPIGNVGSVIYLRTDQQAPNRKVIAVDALKPQSSEWQTIVPERKEAMETVAVIGGRIVAEYLVDVQSRVSMFDLKGASLGDITLPSTGVLAGLAGREDSPTIWYIFTSPLYPATVFAFDPKAGKSTPFEAPKSPIDVSQFETKQLFATSKDGTMVPFFMTARKGLARDGSKPTMMYGYGGFSASTVPTYRADVPAWLEQGGIFVSANMRGGAEYGEAWHKAGMFEKKQNVFDDFIAVAESLERWPAGRRRHGTTSGPLRGCAARRRCDGHATLRSVHRRQSVGDRVRLVIGSEAVPVPVQILAAPQHQTRGLLPGHPGDHGRS